MISKYTYKTLTWVDATNPTTEEIDTLSDSFGLSNLVSESIQSGPKKSSFSNFGDTLVMTLTFSEGTPSKVHGAAEHTVLFVIKKNVVITSHRGHIAALEHFSREFSHQSKMDRSGIVTHAGFFVYYILSLLYSDAKLVSEEIGSLVGDIDKNIFAGHEHKMVQILSNVSKHILSYEHTLQNQGETLRIYEQVARIFFGESFAHYLNQISHDHTALMRELAEYKNTVHEYQKTNNALIASKSLASSRVLSTVTVVLLPLFLICSLVSIGSPYIIKTATDFIVIGIGIIFVGVSILTYVKHKKWF